jgi:hypothetical protein
VAFIQLGELVRTGWVGVVKSLELIDSGPVGLVHTQKIEAQSEKPTWTKAERNSAKFDVTTLGRNPHLAIGSAGSESDEPGSAEHDR